MGARTALTSEGDRRRRHVALVLPIFVAAAAALVLHAPAARASSSTGAFHVLPSSGDGHFTEVHNDTSGWGNWQDGRFFATGDYNGDRRTDWSWYAPWSNDFIVMLSTGDGYFTQVHNDTSGWGNWQDGRFFAAGDYNGDGRTDWSWYAPWSNDFIVMLSTGDGYFTQVHNDTSGWGNWRDGRFFATGDYNGDGRTDWSWYAPWSNDFIVMPSTGDGHFTQVHNDTSGWGNWQDGRFFATGDYNGDGRTDWSWYRPPSPTVTPAPPPPSQPPSGPPVIEGYRYVGKPGCATNLIGDHPGAYLRTDPSTGNLVCCERSFGVNTAACGRDRWAFPPDCMQYCVASVGGCLVELLQPGGCYRWSGW